MNNFHVDSLQINPPKITVDSYATKVLEELKNDLLPKDNGKSISQAEMLTKSGWMTDITKLSTRLNEARLDDDITQFLLSDREIYAIAICRATGYRSDQSKEEKEKTDKIFDDIDALILEVPRQITEKKTGIKTYFLGLLVAKVFDAKGYKIGNITQPRWQLLDDLILAKDIPISSGNVEPAVKKIWEKVNHYGEPMYYLNEYINSERNKIDKGKFSEDVKILIVDYLIDQGIKIDDKNNYDNHFIQAYDAVIKQNVVTNDPIDSTRVKGSEISWNFVIETFDSVESQGVVPLNIKAAGALDYVYCLGEMMRVFDVANALVLRWASGWVDVPGGKTATALYRFHKLRDDRNTPEERAMLYKRILNRGNGQLLSTMVVNDAFSPLWHQLMTEVTQYIQKVEGSSSRSFVSRASIFQATRNLQYNLSEHMKGMAHIQVTEDYAHLKEAVELLNAPEVVDNFGGRRKSVWSVIEQIAKEDLGVVISTSNIRTLAVEGNKIFQWLANFDEGKTQDSEFQQLLISAEAWIIAQASLESNGGFQPPQQPGQSQMPDFLNNMNMPNFGQKVDEFADW